MYDGTTKSIENVQIGEMVYGYNGEINEVVDTHQFEAEDRVIYTINEQLELTESHPVLTSAGWKSFNVEATLEIHPEMDVSELAAGNKLVKYSEQLETHEDKLRSINRREEFVAVYNLDVDGDDTFVVNNFVVHNK